MKETDVILITPNTLGSYKFSGKQRETLALSCLGAYLSQNNISNQLIDARFDNLTSDQVAKDVIKLKPRLVGITLMEQEPVIWSKALVKQIKEELPKTHITTGSYFPTLNSQKCLDMLPEIDSIIQGEGEETLLELTLQVKNKNDWKSTDGIAFKNDSELMKNPRRKLISNLNTLPEPIRYADGKKMSKVSLEGSRGCFSSCTFCSINPHLNPGKSSWRGKEPERIVKELVNLRHIYPNINQFRFADADFIGLGKYSERLSKIGRELIKNGFSSANSKIFIETQSKNALSISPNVWKLLQQAGLYQVFIGVENGDEKIKKCLGKRSSVEDDMKAIDYLKSFGFNVTYGFIMINPWSDMKNVLGNAGLLKSLGNAGLDKYFSELILNPGTRAFETVSKENGIYIEKVENVDRYLYPLPNPIESLRQVNNYMLEHPKYKSFLESITSLYSQIDEGLLNRKNEKLLGLRNDLDQMNLEIFLKITDAIQQHNEVISTNQLEILLSNVIETYRQKVSFLASVLG